MPLLYISWAVHGCSFLATTLLNQWSIIHFELFLDISEQFLGPHIQAIGLAQLNLHLIYVSLHLLLDPHSIIPSLHGSGYSAWSQSPFGYSSWYVPSPYSSLPTSSQRHLWPPCSAETEHRESWTPRTLTSFLIRELYISQAIIQ